MNTIKQLYDYKNNNIIDLDKVIDDFTPYIKTVINNMACNYLSFEDKEEVLTDTFFVLWKNQDKDITYLEAYLAGIARNLIKEKFKKNNITYNIDDYENLIDYYNNVELFSEKREKINKLKISYKELKEDEFQMISMFYYSSKSVKDIAKELNISESNVKTKLFRIRKKLKRYLI